MRKFLASSNFIDWEHPAVLAKAKQLAEGLDDANEIVRSCFHYVRDEIKHSWDYKLNPVTCKASNVLEHKTGYCYAKSHLLAALLRANKMPAGLCYQRLTIQNNQPPFSLHGLNAIYLSDYGWYRVDARGNKTGVEAEFCPPIEKLAFSIVDGEADLPEVWAEPLPRVVKVLESSSDFQEIADNLPDAQFT